MPILTLIPAILAIIYTIVVKFRSRKLLDAALMLIGGGCALYNAVFMYGFFTSEIVSTSLRCIQQVISCLIVPVAYMYFAAQMGRQWLNGVTITLWGLVLLLLVPTGLYTIDGQMPDLHNKLFASMTHHVFSGREEIFMMRSADIIIMLQALLTLERMFDMAYTLRRYHLSFSPRLRYFLAWWAGAIVFIVFTSVHTTQDFAQPLLLWTYYIMYSILVTSIFILLALDFDLHPIMLHTEDNDNENFTDRTSIVGEPQPASDTIAEAPADRDEHEDESGKKEEEVVRDVDSFIMHTRVMAEQVRVMLAEKRYLDSDLTADSTIRSLGTNRTYFARMMKAEFGCTFTELITKHRMEHAEHLLLHSDQSIQEIALHCGFSDQTSFSRRFRMVHGISPSKYRANR